MISTSAAKTANGDLIFNVLQLVDISRVLLRVLCLLSSSFEHVGCTGKMRSAYVVLPCLGIKLNIVFSNVKQFQLAILLCLTCLNVKHCFMVGCQLFLPHVIKNQLFLHLAGSNQASR